MRGPGPQKPSKQGLHFFILKPEGRVTPYFEELATLRDDLGLDSSGPRGPDPQFIKYVNF